MPVGILKIELYLPCCTSLKEKRKYLNSIKGRLKSRLNVAVSELAHQDLWQRSIIGAVTINSSGLIVEQTLQKILAEVEKTLPGDIVSARREVI
jgi:uncharacterized protein YlxP (DUF503 family)